MPKQVKYKDQEGHLLDFSLNRIGPPEFETTSLQIAENLMTGEQACTVKHAARVNSDNGL
jgi:hypothetical protein